VDLQETEVVEQLTDPFLNWQIRSDHHELASETPNYYSTASPSEYRRREPAVTVNDRPGRRDAADKFLT